MISIMFGNLLALLQENLKRILAYSSIAHMGYLLIALIASIDSGGTISVEAITVYLVAYVVMSLGAFGIASNLSTSKVELDNIEDYRGLFWRKPLLATIFTGMLLSLAGIPLTVGFIGKFYIFFHMFYSLILFFCSCSLMTKVFSSLLIKNIKISRVEP